MLKKEDWITEFDLWMDKCPVKWQEIGGEKVEGVYCFKNKNFGSEILKSNGELREPTDHVECYSFQVIDGKRWPKGCDCQMCRES